MASRITNFDKAMLTPCLFIWLLESDFFYSILFPVTVFSVCAVSVASRVF